MWLTRDTNNSICPICLICPIKHYEVLDEETEETIVEPGMTLDVRTTVGSVDELPDFPNPTYKAFMELVEKLKLSNTAGNEIINFFNEHSTRPDKPLPTTTRLGRAFVDSLDVPHILYRKVAVMRYKEHVYYLYFWPIFNVIKKLLQKENI